MADLNTRAVDLLVADFVARIKADDAAAVAELRELVVAAMHRPASISFPPGVRGPDLRPELPTRGVTWPRPLMPMEVNPIRDPMPGEYQPVRCGSTVSAPLPRLGDECTSAVRG